MGQGHTAQGFTLIELSIVLVIIGLIVGGILVGQDLIKAAEVRAQISQIEKYNQAVNTFRAKFQAIPGDMALSSANQFGFADSGCDGTQGKRDGNGLVEGAGGFFNTGANEPALFWQDISSAIAGNLIDGQFPNSGAAAIPGCATQPGNLTTTPGTLFIGDFLPAGKIGHGNFIYVYATSGYNWYGISQISVIYTTAEVVSAGSIPVILAYNIDKKIDDGLPTTGAVQAVFLNGSVTATSAAPNAATDSTTTCYNTISNVYSIGSAANYGAGGNCALSFRFQ